MLSTPNSSGGNAGATIISTDIMFLWVVFERRVSFEMISMRM